MVRFALFSCSLLIPSVAFASADPEQQLVQDFATACDIEGADCAADTAPAALAPSSSKKTSSASARASSTNTFAGTFLSRRVIEADVVEYRIDVRVGPGPYDMIGLHRVVRESSPYVAMSSAKPLMMVHGDAWDFEGAFLPLGGAPQGYALPVYLAQRGVDVWGIDLGWTRVPAGIADFSFMQSWDFARDTRDIGIAIGVARTLRILTGHGSSQMNLLGWSRGGQLAYAFADKETQISSGLRQVKGIIPVDVYLETDDPALKNNACLRRIDERGMVAAGTYANDIGANLGPLGYLAQVSPSGPSPLFAGLDNAHASMMIGAATFGLQTYPAVPSYHMAGGSWDSAGVLLGLVYTGEAVWHDTVFHAKPYQPWTMIADADAATCDDPADDPTFDDHLGSITIPTLYVGAGGGFGASGIYTTTLLGSTDVTTHVVETLPPEYRIADLGHADIFRAAGADTLFWDAIGDWIDTH